MHNAPYESIAMIKVTKHGYWFIWGIMHRLNVSNALNMSINDGKWNRNVQILVSYAWKFRFGTLFADIITSMK